MKALVLTYDRYRPLTEHMLKTYSVLWPHNPFVFLIPYQQNRDIEAHGQRVCLVRAPRPILATMEVLLSQVQPDEWVYWCIDDKFLLGLESVSASYFADYVLQITDRTVTGLCFCRARYLKSTPHVSEHPISFTARGDRLLRRRNFNNIWLHQFMRAGTLGRLFESFPRDDFTAIDMDSYTRQGPEAVGISANETMYVTERNCVVFGESTIGGRITSGCVKSMGTLGLEVPDSFGISDREIVIGSLDDLVGE